MVRVSSPHHAAARLHSEPTNFVVLRGAGQQLLDKRPSPVRLACMNYRNFDVEPIPAYECLSREEGIAKGFVRRVDANLTPKADNGGFLLDPLPRRALGV